MAPPFAVVSLSTVGAMLSLLPGVAMSMGVLKGCLFGPRFARHMSALGLRALRVLEHSGEWNVPYAKRATLEYELDSEIVRLAERRGTPVAKLRHELLTSETEEIKGEFAKLVAHAADALVESTSEREIRELREKVARLERRLGEGR